MMSFQGEKKTRGLTNTVYVEVNPMPKSQIIEELQKHPYKSKHYKDAKMVNKSSRNCVEKLVLIEVSIELALGVLGSVCFTTSFTSLQICPV